LISNVLNSFDTGLFVFLAPGSGAVKPNLIVMGGDQFDEDDPREAKMKSSYFSYFYWCTNIAAFAAFSVMVCAPRHACVVTVERLPGLVRAIR
jgi:dipeptide/tripeptide permease